MDRLSKIWEDEDMSLNTKIKLCETQVISEWNTSFADVSYFRRMVGISRMESQRNENSRRKINVNKTLLEINRKRRLQWLGHVERNPVKSFI